jgi:hypothetical protein
MSEIRDEAAPEAAAEEQFDGRNPVRRLGSSMIEWKAGMDTNSRIMFVLCARLMCGSSICISPFLAVGADRLIDQHVSVFIDVHPAVFARASAMTADQRAAYVATCFAEARAELDLFRSRNLDQSIPERQQ